MKTRRPPCLDWREKLALRHEDLSPTEQQALDAHVRTCEACSTALSDYHFFEARLDALPPPAIKPLPRLSPHFFELSSRESSEQPEQLESNTPPPDSTPRRHPVRKQNKAVTIVWRALSIAAVLCLLLGAGAIFRVIYSARLAAHPSGDTLLNLDQHTDFVASAAWSPNGQEIATASWDHTVKIWSAATGNLVCTYQSADAVYTLAWSPNSQLIASGGNDSTVRIWNAANCSLNTSYAVHTETGPIVSVAWSPNGQSIASGGWDYMAQIWNARTGNILFSIPFTDVVSSIAWSPNGQQIAAGSWDRTVQIWHTNTEQSPQTYSYSDSVTAVAWSPNGRYLAIGNYNGTVEVKDVTNGNIICNYTQHTDAINAVAWSPDGKEIASGSNDKTARVWNPFGKNTPTLMIYTEHTDDVSSVAWSPDGKEIVSGSWDHTAKVWKVVA